MQPKAVQTPETKRQKLIEAFVYHHSIDKSVYDEKLERLDDEIALAALDAYDAKVEELDVEAALNYGQTRFAMPRSFGFNVLRSKTDLSASAIS